MFTKDQARLTIEQRYKVLSDKQYDKRRRAALNRLVLFLKQYDNSHGMKTVLSYDSFAAWKEVDLSSLINFFPDIDITVVARQKDAIIHNTQYDVILVPLFGFTKGGYRLGHGGGWYDRMLSRQQKSLKVGVGFEEGRIDYPVEPHDIRLDVIITDQHVSLIS